MAEPGSPVTLTRPGGRKVPRTWWYVGGAAVVGIAVYAWWTRSQSAATTPAPLFDEFGNPIAGPTPGTAGGVQMVPPTTVDSNLDTTVGTGFRTNSEWSQFVINYLQGLGDDPIVVSAAIGKFLQRRPLSTAEADMVGQAVAVGGWPPEDRPWTIIPTTATTPSPVPPGVKPGPVTGLQASASPTEILWRWNPTPNADYYKVALIQGESQEIRSGTVVGSSWRTGGLAPKHPYRLRVRAERRGVGTGPYNTLLYHTR